MILGWAEQLEHDTALPDTARRRAAGIRAQSEKLRTLIEDLNLTSKLQYGAQPLRCRPVQAGPLLRSIAAEFCDSPLADHCTVTPELTPDADKAEINVDAALLTRALESAEQRRPPQSRPGTGCHHGDTARQDAGDRGGR